MGVVLGSGETLSCHDLVILRSLIMVAQGLLQIFKGWEMRHEGAVVRWLIAAQGISAAEG